MEKQDLQLGIEDGKGTLLDFWVVYGMRTDEHAEEHL